MIETTSQSPVSVDSCLPLNILVGEFYTSSTLVSISSDFGAHADGYKGLQLHRTKLTAGSDLGPWATIYNLANIHRAQPNAPLPTTILTGPRHSNMLKFGTYT